MGEQSDQIHVTNRTYILIAVILAILTAVEVMVFYIEAMAPVLLPILLVLMVVKFALVAMFFMHLKFDSRILSAVFLWGIFIAVSIICALLAVFGKFSA
jgi:cytochrome c oxidase subunit 4